jgi:hypothetical protein
MKPDLSKKYGLILVDFVNIADTDGAVLSFLNHLLHHFSFSTNFFEEVKRRFPSIISIAAALSDDEKKLLNIILKKNEIVDQLNKQFKLINYGIENYDPRARTISLMSLEWNRDTGGSTPKAEKAGLDAPDGGGFLQTLKLLGLSIVDGPVTIKIDAIRAEIEDLLGPIAAGQISNLIMKAHEIEELILRIGEAKYEKLQLLAEEQREIFDFHKKIAAIKTDCGDTLKMVVEDRPFHDIPALVEYLDIYNKLEPHRLIIADNDRLIPVFPIDEHEYFAANGIAGWLDVLQKLLAYCLIEFLKSEKSRKHLKTCATCRRYFIARQPKRQKYCTTACRTNKSKILEPTLP